MMLAVFRCEITLAEWGNYLIILFGILLSVFPHSLSGKSADKTQESAGSGDETMMVMQGKFPMMVPIEYLLNEYFYGWLQASKSVRLLLIANWENEFDFSIACVSIRLKRAASIAVGSQSPVTPLFG